MQPPPGLFQKNTTPPPGLGSPPGITPPPGIQQQQQRKALVSQNQYVNPYYQFSHSVLAGLSIQQQPTLESLDIGIKISNIDSQDSKQHEDTDAKSETKYNQVMMLFFLNKKKYQMLVSIENPQEQFSYLEPRMNQLVITSDGLIFDVLENDMAALWDKNFNLIRYYKGLFDKKVTGFQLIPLSENKIVKCEQSIISLIDLNSGTRQDIWDCNITMQCVDVTNHNPPRIVAVGSGQFCVWILKNVNGNGVQNAIVNVEAFNGIPKKSNDYTDLIQVAKTNFAFCDSILALDNGQVLAKQTQVGEVFVVNFQTEDVNQLVSTQGFEIQDWAKLSWNQVALSDHTNIIIVDFDGMKEQHLMTIKTPDDICKLQRLEEDKLVTVSGKGEIRIWERTTGKLLKYYSNDLIKNKSDFKVEIVDKNTFMVYSNDEKCISLLQVSYQAQIQITNYLNFKARLRNVLLARVSPCQKYIYLVSESGTFSGGQVDFLPEIEVYTIGERRTQSKKVIPKDDNLGSVCFNTGSITIKKKIDEDTKEEEITLHNQPCIQYIITPKKTISLPILMQWYFTHNIIIPIDLTIERFTKSQLYSFNRMVFSYNYEKAVQAQSQKSQESFNMFAPTQLKPTSTMVMQTFSGISTYDNDQRLLLKVQFEEPYDANVFDMPNETFIYFLNKRQQIEVWNVVKQTMTQKADCRPSLIKQLKFQEQSPYLVFLNGTVEIIVRNHKLGLINKRKVENKTSQYKRSEFIDEERVVLLRDRSLEIWNFKNNQSEIITSDFDMNDFIVFQSPKIIMLVGDYQMKKIIIK